MSSTHEAAQEAASPLPPHHLELEAALHTSPERWPPLQRLLADALGELHCDHAPVVRQRLAAAGPRSPLALQAVAVFQDEQDHPSRVIALTRLLAGLSHAPLPADVGDFALVCCRSLDAALTRGS